MRYAKCMEDDNKLSYFCLGLGLGVAVGILFAPKAGHETRAYLRDRAEEGADILKTRAEELRDQAAEAVDRGKTHVRKHRENLSQAVDAGRQAYRDSTSAPHSD